MAKTEKLLVKIRSNPKTVSFDDLDKVLCDCGFSRRQSGKGTSHYYYTFGSFKLSVPYRRPHVKEIYVKQALAYIDQIVEDDM